MILKLGAMRVNAESATGPVWAVQGDNRRTRIDTFRRGWPCNELQQPGS